MKLWEWNGFPPEMREDQGEIELAQEKKLPVLIEIGDLQETCTLTLTGVME